MNISPRQKDFNEKVSETHLGVERVQGGRRTSCPPYEIVHTKEYEKRKKRLMRARFRGLSLPE